ncbi:MAG: CBS domain-containing protein [Patescibacteria group bacterium]|nr:CBS domain-containing protein [Patescibacteria group bacterium]MBU2509603.1 CBS domain-containing protein [Patescibacteria group bacterium]
MKVRDAMLTDVYTIPSSSTYEAAAKFIYSRNISGVCVLDEEGKLVGILSEKDLFKVLYPLYGSYYKNPEIYTDFSERESKAFEIKDNPISQYMSGAVITIEPETHILVAGARMLAERIHRMPVVEDGKLVGVLTRSRVFNQILRSNFEVSRD